MPGHPARPHHPLSPSLLVPSHPHRYFSRYPVSAMVVLLRTPDPVSAKCPKGSKPSETVEESRTGMAISRTLPPLSHRWPPETRLQPQPKPMPPLNRLPVLPPRLHCATLSQPSMTKRRSSILAIRRNPSNDPLLALQVPCPALAPSSLDRRNNRLSVPVSSLFQIDPIRFYSIICLHRLPQREAFLPLNPKHRRKSQGLPVGLPVIIPLVVQLPWLRSALLRGWSKQWRTNREGGF